MEEVQAGLQDWLALPARIEQALADRNMPIFAAPEHPSVWQRLAGIVFLAAGSGAASLQVAGALPKAWFLPGGLLAVVFGAGLLLRK
jgi:hypothetical protein